MDSPAPDGIMTGIKAWLTTTPGKVARAVVILGLVYWGFGNPSEKDKRIVVGDPNDFILVKEDFPDEYLLPPDWSRPHLNSDILGVRGQEDGKAYIEATGRISGWIIQHMRNDPTKVTPEEIRSYVVMYETVEGAHLAHSPQWDYPNEGFEEVNFDFDLGDWALVTVRRELQDNGRDQVWYQIEFIYQNIWGSVMGWGWESDVNHDYIENLARVMLSKMETAPLVNP